MSKKLFALSGLIATLAGSGMALASGPGEKHATGPYYLEGGAFVYEAFEKALDHVDLEGCPAEFDPDTVFCRMTLHDDQAHVFVFSYEGDQPLLAIKSYLLTDGFLPF
ncbi:hypothetical protein [Thalassovita sp.]|uniref:hypothetical protein n=1 Tax=Thalassovita sp. TaxID=1979401 RepID=UPI002B272FA9|nr:hypothetical protein [Thalassovita sp.]